MWDLQTLSVLHQQLDARRELASKSVAKTEQSEGPCFRCSCGITITVNQHDAIAKCLHCDGVFENVSG